MNNMIRNSIAAFLMAVGSAASSATIPFSFGEVKVDCEDRDGWTLAFSREDASDGAEIAKIVLDCAEAKSPASLATGSRSSRNKTRIKK